MAVAFAGLWVLSPIDLIPEFLPVIGPLDDIVVVAQDRAAIDEAAGTATETKAHAYAGSPGYAAETATMTLIRSFLVVIAALVVGAFFTVLTIQRTKQIGLLKAMGASNAYVLRDGVGQMGVVVVAGTLVGSAVADPTGSVHGRDPAELLTALSPRVGPERLLDLLLRTFPLRTCSDNKFEHHAKLGRPCLLFHIEKCSGPCVGEIDKPSYDKLVTELMEFLDGDHDPVLRRLEAQMAEAAGELAADDNQGVSADTIKLGTIASPCSWTPASQSASHSLRQNCSNTSINSTPAAAPPFASR